MVIPFSFSGCKKEDLLLSSISELKSDIFYGESENYSIKASYGFRENPYINDGKVSPLQNVLIFKLLNKQMDEATYSVSLEYGGKTYSENFTHSPVRDQLTATIVIDDFIEKEFIVKIVSATTSEEVKLLSTLPSKTLNYKDALIALKNEQSELIKSYTDADGNFTAEIYMRVIVKEEKPYYYVGFGSGNDKLKALLVDGLTGKTLAIREIF